MSKFRFIGDPNDNNSGPQRLNWEGLAFDRVNWTNVPDELAMRLFKNTHFECDGNPALIVQPPASPVAAVVAQPAAAATDLRSSLLAQAEAMGVEVDKRWGVAKLQEAIANGQPA
jgi:hypothetical protein